MAANGWRATDIKDFARYTLGAVIGRLIIKQKNYYNMNELLIAEISKKIGLFLLTIIGVLLFVFGFAVWLTNGTIIDRVKPKVIHDTIYLPIKK